MTCDNTIEKIQSIIDQMDKDLLILNEQLREAKSNSEKFVINKLIYSCNSIKRQAVLEIACVKGKSK